MIRPTLDEVRKMAEEGKYKYVPLSTQMLSDVRTPIEVLRILKNVSGHCYLLESAEEREKWGRYTFLGFDPTMQISCMNGKMTVDTVTFDTNDPGSVIRQIITWHKSPVLDYLPPFTGGLVGYFSYDYLKYSEPELKPDGEDTEGFQDLDLMLFDKVIAFDHYENKLILIVNISLENPEQSYHKGELELKTMKDLILNGKMAPIEPGRLKGEMKPLMGKKQYCEMVERAKKHIVEGDIFQIVLSNRLEADFEGSLLNTYRIMRTINPSPYMFYFSSSALEVAGASPETLVKLENGVLHTFPLAGTRRRGKTPEEDKALEEGLLKDPKELAEHSMLVDLGRNDLGKVSRFGTVEVESAYHILRYSHVMHIGSTVRGIIREDKDAMDAIAAVLPAGTLSGAPKIMACRLIHELENNKRGIYGGAFGYVSFTGSLDTCIGIRLAYAKNGKVFVRSGAGIVADSVPENEYQECLNKAAAVVQSLKDAELIDEEAGI